MSILEQLPVWSWPHWLLYVDWCEAQELMPVPATGEQLASYLRAVPAAFGTSVARIRPLWTVHTLVAEPFPIPLFVARSAVRTGEG